MSMQQKQTAAIFKWLTKRHEKIILTWHVRIGLGNKWRHQISFLGQYYGTSLFGGDWRGSFLFVNYFLTPHPTKERINED